MFYTKGNVQKRQKNHSMICRNIKFLEHKKFVKHTTKPSILPFDDLCQKEMCYGPAYD